MWKLYHSHKWCGQVLPFSFYHKTKSEITLTLNFKHSTVPTTRRKINSVPAATHPLRDGIFTCLSLNVSQIISSTFFCQSVLFCAFLCESLELRTFLSVFTAFHLCIEQIILPVTCEQINSSALCTLVFGPHNWNLCWQPVTTSGDEKGIS